MTPMTASRENLLRNREAIETFLKLLRENPGRYVVVTPQGESLVSASNEEARHFIEKRKLNSFCFGHEPPAHLKLHAYASNRV